MNGVLRVAISFYVRSRIQRWFFALALISLIARMLILRAPCDCNSIGSIFYLVSVMPTLGFASVSLMVSAGDFRLISSLKTVYLIPGSRAQLICGLLLAQILAAALVTLIVVSLGISQVGPSAWGSPRGTFEFSFGVATTLVVAMQVIAGPSRLASVLTGGLTLGLLARPDIYLESKIAGVPTADVLAIAAFVTWVGYAAWYLRTGPITPLEGVWKSRRDRPATQGVTATTTTREAALDVYLLGQRSFWWACRAQLFHWTIFIASSSVLEISPFFRLNVAHAPPPDFTALIMLLLFIWPTLLNQVAGLIARNSHTLWLYGDESRASLFLRAERLAWRAVGYFGVPLIISAAIAWTALPHRNFAVAYLTALVLPLVTCGIYCGLLNFTGKQDLRFFALFLIVGMGSCFAAVLHADSSPEAIGGVSAAYWAIPPAIVVLAITIRGSALRRWRMIDWMRYRAPRRTTVLRS